jgi:hypothetical protein
VTEWVTWFVQQIRVSCEEASRSIDDALAKARFWMDNNGQNLTERQRKAMNVLLDAGPNGFEGSMSTRKYERHHRHLPGHGVARAHRTGDARLAGSGGCGPLDDAPRELARLGPCRFGDLTEGREQRAVVPIRDARGVFGLPSRFCGRVTS